uniref:Uncharacterized protein n=1 Tax=viral metagenome TaxID=1070528 RepID=A0A6C0HVH2_9ZZZZ
MNNILDYSHMIKTYIMTTEFEPIDDIKCNCDKNIECFQINELHKCKYNKLIIDNLPLFNILINLNIKTKFSLPKELSSSSIDIVTFINILLYIIKFKDESIDYLLNKKYIKCIILLNIYTIIITNQTIIKNVMYMFESLIIKLKYDLTNNYLNNEDNINKLKILFKKYFKESPDECINIMKSWDILLQNIIDDK